MLKKPKNTPAHGGKRQGAGRKPIAGERLVQCSITIEPAVRDQVKEFGNGNLSAGIRELLAAFNDLKAKTR